MAPAPVLVEPAARENAHPGQAACVENAAHAAREGLEVAAVQPDAADLDAELFQIHQERIFRPFR
mgnify:CR=1 FL=1